ncbi:sensory neuron membrane protein 2 [Colletes latitarsis]|uniref:sensory neuron membrane protein 2 n=1 Tax=Colletes latitarsis TaxID=2605962 RepID=UPI004036C81F
MLYYGIFGLIMILFGLKLVSEQYLTFYITLVIHKEINLVKGSLMYETWSSPLDLSISCYLFNVTNPDDVMQGENPRLVEYGPFVYNELFEKQVIDVDEENDEITYTTRSTYTFNKRRSLRVSSHDKVTILNPAYLGSILTLTSLPADFMKKYGDNIPKLFQNRTSIFLKAKATDILFDGVKVSCNVRKFPELNLICKTMQSKPPPVLQQTDKEEVFLLSIFQRVRSNLRDEQEPNTKNSFKRLLSFYKGVNKINNTIRGPYTVNRGLRNVSLIGYSTAFKGQKEQEIWHSEECNKIRGSDSITWAPLLKPTSTVVSFSPDLCRSIETDFEKKIAVHGIVGLKFAMQERVWHVNQTQCYCPVVKNEAQCLPQGLIDESQCQMLPVMLSEPHFLHGDPKLLDYARGLKPDKKLHETYIAIEPLTGTPIAGQKCTQINMKLTKQPVKLLANVSEGYFPILWCKSVMIFRRITVASVFQKLGMKFISKHRVLKR